MLKHLSEFHNSVRDTDPFFIVVTYIVSVSTIQWQIHQLLISVKQEIWGNSKQALLIRSFFLTTTMDSGALSSVAKADNGICFMTDWQRNANAFNNTDKTSSKCFYHISQPVWTNFRSNFSWADLRSKALFLTTLTSGNKWQPHPQGTGDNHDPTKHMINMISRSRWQPRQEQMITLTSENRWQPWPLGADDNFDL